MPFIGNQPTAVPLTSADLEDNIISTAKIQDNAVTTAKTSYSDAPYRNIIINGDMSIAQRNTSVAGITSTGYYTVDRWSFVNTFATYTMSQSTDVPTGQGFATSLKLDCTTANASPASGDNLRIRQNIEGQMLQYLKKGTANAESLTLSFWVKSTKTGTFIAELRDDSNARQIAKSYTIDASNTWEKKTITFPGDTTGAFTNNNAQALSMQFWLGAGTSFTSGTLATSWESIVNANRAVGQVNIADSTSNDWFVTGVQLEAGTTASDFEFLPVDVNLQRCQRYFQKISSGYVGIASGWGNGGSDLPAVMNIPVKMRATPTFSNFTAMGAMPSNKSNSSPGINALSQIENGKIYFQTNGWGGTLTNQEIYLVSFTTNDCFISAEL